MFGPWQDSIERLFGVRRTSGDRSREEQNSLHRRGKTRLNADQSAHSRAPDSAIDLPPIMSADEANRRARAAGIPVRFIHETGRGRNQGTGAHLHGERLSRGVAVASRASGSERNQNVASSRGNRGRLLSRAEIESLETESAREEPGNVSGMASLNEITAATGDDTGTHPVINPFEAGVELRERAGAVEERLGQQARLLDRNEATMESMQESRRLRTERSVAEKRGINDMVQEGNRELLNRVQPLLARQAQVTQRMGELATMNPLERGLRGIFDLNYNQDYLARVNEDIGAAVQSAGQQYQVITTLQEQYMQSLDREDQNESRLDDLTLAEMNEDTAMMAQGMNAAIQSFGFLNQQIDANASVIRGQILTRDNLLSSMDAGEINSLLESARNSPDGYVEVDGVRIGTGELQVRSDQWESQQLALENARLSIQQNRIQMAEANATRLAGTMTEAQLNEAAANGGMYQGVQIPNDVIARNLQAHAMRIELQTNAAVRRGSLVDSVQRMGSQIQHMRGVLDRARSVGPVGNRFDQSTAQIANRMTAITNRLAEIRRTQGNAVADAAAPALMQEYQALSEQFDRTVNQLATQYAGSSQAGQRLMGAFLRGEPINSNEATQMMIEFVDQGGMPTSMRSSTVFQSLFARTQQATREVDAQIRNMQGARPNATQRRAMIADRARAAAPQTVAQSSMRQIFQMLPDIARSMNHPFSGVRREDLLRAQQTGNREAFAAIGARLGINAQQAQQLFGGRAPDGVAPQQAAELLRRVEDMRAPLMAQQRASMLRALDESPSARPDFRPSEAFIDLITSNGFYRRVANFEQAQSSFSFGDALAGSMGGGMLVSAAQEYGNSMRSIANDQTTAARSSGRYAASAYALLPANRTAAILGAIDSLNQEDEQLLLAAVARAVPNYNGANIGQVSQVNTSVRGFIVNNRFDDPRLERVRRIAAAEYDTAAERMDRAMDRMAITSRTGSGPLGALAGALFGSGSEGQE